MIAILEKDILGGSPEFFSASTTENYLISTSG